MISRNKLKNILVVFTLLAAVVLFMLASGCAAVSPEKIMVTERFIVRGPEKSVEKLLKLYDLDKMNREVAGVYGVQEKFGVINILDGFKFREKFAGTPCEASNVNGCYSQNKIYLRDDVNNMIGFTIYHEMGHRYYGRSENLANAIACRFVDSYRCVKYN